MCENPKWKKFSESRRAKDQGRVVSDNDACYTEQLRIILISFSSFLLTILWTFKIFVEELPWNVTFNIHILQRTFDVVREQWVSWVNTSCYNKLRNTCTSWLQHEKSLLSSHIKSKQMFLISKEVFLQVVTQRPRHFLFCGSVIFNQRCHTCLQKMIGRWKQRRVSHTHLFHADSSVKSHSNGRHSWELKSKFASAYLARHLYYLKELFGGKMGNPLKMKCKCSKLKPDTPLKVSY